MMSFVVKKEEKTDEFTLPFCAVVIGFTTLF
jgi:hypothetical protein